MNSRLRIGLLLDSYLLPVWTFTAIERILHSHCAELALIVLNRSQTKRCPSLIASKRGSEHWLYRIFNAIDEKLFLRGPIASTQINSLGILSNVPVLAVNPI